MIQTRRTTGHTHQHTYNLDDHDRVDPPMAEGGCSPAAADAHNALYSWMKVGGVMVQLATGTAADGTTWELDVSGGAEDLHTMVSQKRPDGRTPWGGGCGGPAVPPGRRVTVSMGVADDAMRTFIARVSADVRAVVVTLSDGTREDLILHGDPAELGARVAVLLYDRELDVHRVDLLGHDGQTLPEEQ